MKTLEVRLILVDDGTAAGGKTGKEIIFREMSTIPINKGISGTEVAKMTARVYERIAPFLKPAVALADIGGDAPLAIVRQSPPVHGANVHLPSPRLVSSVQRDADPFDPRENWDS